MGRYVYIFVLLMNHNDNTKKRNQQARTRIKSQFSQHVTIYSVSNIHPLCANKLTNDHNNIMEL